GNYWRARNRPGQKMLVAGCDQFSRSRFASQAETNSRSKRDSESGKICLTESSTRESREWTRIKAASSRRTPKALRAEIPLLPPTSDVWTYFASICVIRRSEEHTSE